MLRKVSDMEGEPTVADLRNLAMMVQLVSGYQRIAQAGLAAELGEISQQAALDKIMLIGHQVMDAIKPNIDKMEKYHGTAN